MSHNVYVFCVCPQLLGVHMDQALASAENIISQQSFPTSGHLLSCHSNFFFYIYLCNKNSFSKNWAAGTGFSNVYVAGVEGLPLPRVPMFFMPMGLIWTPTSMTPPFGMPTTPAGMSSLLFPCLCSSPSLLLEDLCSGVGFSVFALLTQGLLLYHGRNY